MIVDRTPQDNAAVSFERPGLSFNQGRYNGYNPLFAGNQPAPGRAADWNWLSLYFSTAQSALQSGAVPTGGKLTNESIFGLYLPDMTQGSVLFAGAGGLVSQNNASFFWDNTTSNGAPALSINSGTSLTKIYKRYTSDGIGDVPPAGVVGSARLDLMGTMVAGAQLTLSHYEFGELVFFKGDGAAVNRSVLEFWGVDNTGTHPICTMVTGSATEHEIHVARNIADTDAIICAYPTAAGPVIYTETARSAFIDFGVQRTRVARVGTTFFGSQTDGSADLGGASNRWANVRYTTQLLAPDGSAATPSIAFASETGLGMHYVNPSQINFDSGGASFAALSSANGMVCNQLVLDANNADTILVRDAAKVMALKNAGNAMEFRVYGTTTGPKYMSFKHDGTNALWTLTGGGSTNMGTNASITGKRLNLIGFANTAGTDANLEIGDNTGTVYWKFARTNSNTFRMDLSSTLAFVGASQTIQFTGTATNQNITLGFYDNVLATLKGRILYAGGNGAGSRYIGFVNDAADYFSFFSDRISFNNSAATIEAFRIDLNQIFSPRVTLATNMTTGFINIPGAAGAPTGTPATTVGFSLYLDSTNSIPYFYNSFWRSHVGQDQANGQQLVWKSVTELTTIAAAATTDTAIQIPANAVVLAVTVRVTTVIPTAATFTVTGTTSGTQFDVAGGVSTAANTTDVGTRNCTYSNGAAQTIRITPNLNPAANTGRVRVTIHYYLPTPPTS